MTYHFTDANPPAPPVELSDGTAVILEPGAGTLSYSTDRTTLNSIATAVGGARSRVCRDASDNLYVIHNNSLTAFTKGTGLTWTQKTTVAVTIGWQTNPTPPNYTICGWFWTHTGGTGGAGQLAYVIILPDDEMGVTLYDAGVALAGAGGNPYLSSFAYTSTISFASADVIQDGFGNPGFWITSGNSTGIAVFYTTITAAAPSLTGSYTISPAGSVVAQPVGARYAPGAQFAVYKDSGAKWVILGSTGIITGPTAYTSPTGISTVNDAAYVASVGKVWFYGYSGTVSAPLVRFAVTPSSSPTIDTAATTETISGYTASNPGNVIVVGSQSTSLVDYMVQNVDGGGTIWGGFTTYAAAPGAPTLTAPGVNAYVDATGTINFTAAYNSLDGAPQNAFAFRVKQSGGSYQYWNATSGTLVGSVVWNTISTPAGSSFTLSMPANTLTNGNTYNWSMASQESYGSLQGPFASDSTFGAQTTPVLSVTGPTGTVTDAMPIITWITTPAGGTSQINYRIVIETGAYSTVPGSGTTIWDSGVVVSGGSSAQVGTSLANNTTFRAFVQVQETGAQASAWQFVTFNVAFDQPAVPTLTVTPDTDPVTGAARMTIGVRGHDNLLSLADGSFEGTLGTWAATSGVTLTDSTSQALDGSFSARMASTSTSPMVAATAPYTVLPSTEYTAMCSFRANTTGRACTVSLLFYDASSTLLATVASSAATDNNTGWTKAAVSATAPFSAATAVLQATVASAASGEVHYMDEAGIFPGSVTLWCRGGLVGSTETTVTRVDPNYPAGIPVRFGVGVPIPAATQLATVYDYEAPIGVLCTYTANVQADI